MLFCITYLFFCAGTELKIILRLPIGLSTDNDTETVVWDGDIVKAGFIVKASQDHPCRYVQCLYEFSIIVVALFLMQSELW